jgi:hypothetical protein
LTTLRGWAGRFVLLALSIGVSLAIAEASLELLMSAPPRVLWALPGGTLSHLRAYYTHHERRLVQSMPECARYDAGLFYTLRPGECRFQNREYDTRLVVNSAGVRDDEASLQAPEVIVTGDSFAMGWGVAQDESFPQLLERGLGRPVLNVGVPSYGTVRERRILDRVDTRQLRCLVVQYDDNDPPENELFERNHDTLVINPERAYRQDVLRGGRRDRYWFPKATFEIVRAVFSPPAGVAPDPGRPEHQARLFVKAMLKAGRTDLAGVHVIVVALNADRIVSPAFIDALEGEVSKPGYPNWLRELRVVDVTGLLGRDDYYVLDDHLRASGHAKVASALLPAVRAALGTRP